MDENLKEQLSIIIEACRIWTTKHQGEVLYLSYEAVERLYDLLIELEDIIKGV